MRFLFVILATFCLASCGSNEEKEPTQVKQETPATSQPVIPAPLSTPTATMVLPKPSDLAQYAIKEITGFYGGVGKSSNGTTDKGKRFCRIDISGSAALDSNVKITELNISNIAILFYKNLIPYRDSIDEIVASITFGDGQKLVKTYAKDRLELVMSKMATITKLVNLLQQKNYAAMAPLFNDKSHIVYDKMKLIENIKNAESRLLPVKEFIPYGFMYIKTEKKKEILHIAGVLLREQGSNNEFSIDFDPNTTKEEVLFLNYKL